MDYKNHLRENAMEKPICLVLAGGADPVLAKELSKQFHIAEEAAALTCGDPFLVLDGNGLSLRAEDQTLQGDFTHLLPRLKGLSGEFLVKAAKIKNAGHVLTAIDATAGLGEDSFFLAAAGFHVTMFERNPVVFALLQDALRRAAQVPELADIIARMYAVHGDSIEGMKQTQNTPDVVLLDPMFPARQKSALVKKKLQMIQKLETPCMDERELILAAMGTKPKKLVIKRPPKGPYLADLKPDHSIEGKAVRFDCFVSPYDRIHKFHL